MTLAAIFASCSAQAAELRIATYNAELFRKGPGVLLRDLLAGKDKQIKAVVAVINETRPDVLALQSFDHDIEGHSLRALQMLLERAGHPMPFSVHLHPNSGVQTGLDLDGDGRIEEPRDAQGYGRFTGQGGMAVLSRFPLGAPIDFTTFLWSDLPGAIPPHAENGPYPSAEAFAIQRLSSVAHWDVPVRIADQPPLHLLTFHATTPVFDGDEDRNGRRNHDEIAFWQRYLNGELDTPAPTGRIVIAGDANLDPVDGDGRQVAIQSLLARTDLQDPQPKSLGGQAAADPDHAGNPALDTVDWPDNASGNLRVSYVLPDSEFTVLNSGVFWPLPGDPMHEIAITASRHRLVWVDIRF